MSRLAPLALILALLLALAGCAAADTADPELAGRGNPTPEGVVESFLESFNAALSDANLAVPEVRRAWAERLASYFAPAERFDQRQVMGELLRTFADTSARPFTGSRVQLQISFSGVATRSRDGNQATVAVADGLITLRWLDDQGAVVRERSGELATLLGQQDNTLPVIRVGPSWFMTEG